MERRNYEGDVDLWYDGDGRVCRHQLVIPLKSNAEAVPDGPEREDR